MLVWAMWLRSQPVEYTGSFEQMKAEARAENKPMALYFYSSPLCSPCQTFESQSLADSRVETLLNTDFLFLTLNGESLENNGFQIASQYRITLYPTLILFHPDGTIASNKAGLQPPTILLPELRKVVPARHTTASTGGGSASGSSGSAPTTSAFHAPATRARASDHNGWWHIKVKPLPAKGYGVQVGVFSSYDTINDEINRLSPHYNYPMAIRSGMLNGRQVFKLVFGPFPSMDVARQFESIYERGEDRQAYIVNMGE